MKRDCPDGGNRLVGHDLDSRKVTEVHKRGNWASIEKKGNISFRLNYKTKLLPPIRALPLPVNWPL